MTSLKEFLKSMTGEVLLGNSETDDNRYAPIFLVGFMAAGKTTVGRALAAQLSYHFIDLDEFIERRVGKRVREIFAEFGEAHFRRLERRAIEESRNWQKTVVALGGGAYIDETNRALLRGIGKTVWLDCPLEICLSRIARDGSRPLAKSADEMRELLERRLPAYSQSDYIVRVEGKSVEEVASEVSTILYG